MKTISLQIVTNDFARGSRIHVAQDEFCVSTQPQYTVLRSCVCIGFHHAQTKTGAISHFTGFHLQGPTSAAGLLNQLHTAFSTIGIELRDCKCFVLGGAEKTPRPFQAAIRELQRRAIPFTVLDQLGAFHRKLAFDPATGGLTLFKKRAAGDAKGYFAAGESLDGFTDVTRRIATGATTFFRNPALLRNIADTVLPALAPQSPRFHVWCAGCSSGMEVYSIAMVVLDWIARAGRPLQFKILGSDISEEALETARAGRYPSGRHASPRNQLLFAKYMNAEENGAIAAGPQLRAVTLFKQRDIAQGSHRHRFELVVCDHVFQYFTEARQFEYVASLVRACQPGGFLYVSTPLHQVATAIAERYPLERLGQHFYRMRE